MAAWNGFSVSGRITANVIGFLTTGYVPLPRRRWTSPARASSRITEAIVARDTPNFFMSARSLGMGADAPYLPSAIAAFSVSKMVFCLLSLMGVFSVSTHTIPYSHPLRHTGLVHFFSGAIWGETYMSSRSRTAAPKPSQSHFASISSKLDYQLPTANF